VNRVKTKARLVNLLRESLFADAKPIVNMSREQEIEDLANKVAKEKEF
jgi:hypothetical protein